MHFINEGIAEDLYGYLGGTLNNLGCQPVKIGGIEDHIHILCCMSKNITIIKLLQELKQSSSKWIKTKGNEFHNFYWQDGYGAFTVSPRYVEKLVSYISNQKEHHSKKSFKEEYIEFLERNGIQYDLRYVWD